jgi:hypothetical protein
VVEEEVNLWEGEAIDFASVRGKGTLIHRDTIGGIGVAAVVADRDLVATFCAASRLVAATRELLRYREAIELWARHLPREERVTFLLALARVQVALEDTAAHERRGREG